MSNSRRNAKTIDKLMKIAKTTEESVFQRNKDYLKFKSQKIIKITEIDFILSKFYHLKYPEESIYWNERVLEEKICDKEKRYHFFNNLIHLYGEAKEYELVLEYGQKAQIWFEECGFKVLWHDMTMFDRLGHAANQLKRFDVASKYFKERLKYGLKVHKEGKSHDGGKTKAEQWELLAHYKDLIDCQIKNNCFDDAIKTFEKIKIFKLYSMDPKDVHECLVSFNSQTELDVGLGKDPFRDGYEGFWIFLKVGNQ